MNWYFWLVSSNLINHGAFCGKRKLSALTIQYYYLVISVCNCLLFFQQIF